MTYVDANTKDWVVLIKNYGVSFFSDKILPYVLNLMFGGGNKSKQLIPDPILQKKESEMMKSSESKENLSESESTKKDQ